MMTTQAQPDRAQRLKAATSAVHDRLDRKVMDAASFDDLAGYTRFLRMQRAFHHDIAGLYGDARLRQLLPGLAARQRLALIDADLADLEVHLEAAHAPCFPPDAEIAVPEALGWLYVAEGSNVGAALLRKQAAKLGLSDSHGARHLAPTGEGPAAHWRAFTQALDAIDLADDDEARVIAGARAAFAHVQSLADACLG